MTDIHVQDVTEVREDIKTERDSLLDQNREEESYDTYEKAEVVEEGKELSGGNVGVINDSDEIEIEKVVLICGYIQVILTILSIPIPVIGIIPCLIGAIVFIIYYRPVTPTKTKRTLWIELGIAIFNIVYVFVGVFLLIILIPVILICVLVIIILCFPVLIILCFPLIFFCLLPVGFCAFCIFFAPVLCIIGVVAISTCCRGSSNTS